MCFSMKSNMSAFTDTGDLRSKAQYLADIKYRRWLVVQKVVDIEIKIAAQANENNR